MALPSRHTCVGYRWEGTGQSGWEMGCGVGYEATGPNPAGLKGRAYRDEGAVARVQWRGCRGEGAGFKRGCRGEGAGTKVQGRGCRGEGAGLKVLAPR